MSTELFSGADNALFGMVAGLSNEDEGTRTTTTIMMAMMVVLMIREYIHGNVLLNVLTNNA